MLTVISDLHFEEEKSDAISGGGKTLKLDRNVPAAAFAKLFSSLAKTVTDSGAKHLDLVLAGDIFDLHRTTLWFKGAERPYVNNAKVDGPHERAILNVLNEIAKEPEVGQTLGLLSLLAKGRYRERIADPKSEIAFPVPVTIHYLPGNHDRLLNATKPIRDRVRALLGLAASPNPFPHVLSFKDPRVLVRHGHEYDRFNFSENYERFEPFPATIPDEHYDNATFGDFITLEVATALPQLFLSEYGAAKILTEPVYSALYLRLLEFDDVRPQSSLIEFLLNLPGGPGEDAVWDLLKPVVKNLLDKIHDDDFLRSWLHWLGMDGISFLLKTKFWHLDFTLDILKKHASSFMNNKGPGCVAIAGREPGLSDLRFVIAGHTHEPQVAIIGPKEQYYVDTGTWRHRVLCNGEMTGRVKALTYVTVFAGGEDPGDPGVKKTESFDFWSGFTQRW